MRSFFLKTHRLIFSTWEEADLPLAKSLWGNPKVTEFISATGIFTQEEIKKRLQTEISNQKNFNVQYWPMFLNENKAFIGCCGLRPYSKEEKVYEIGFHLLPEFWGKGYATEGATAVIDYAYSVVKVSGLFAGHNPKNKNSAHTLKKLGFVYTHDEFYPPTGLMHPSYLHKK